MAAWHRLLGHDFVGATTPYVSILFVDNKERAIPLLPTHHALWPQNICLKDTAQATMVALQKDGGDDPDCTHNAIMYGSMATMNTKPYEQDHVLTIGQAMIVVRCVEGVGISTRAGLDCIQGKWAITPGPLSMLRNNLAHAGLRHGTWLLELGVCQGTQLAAKTLNPQLGVIGGLSLLGTTGLVRPYSHEAHTETIRLCVQAHAKSKGEHIVFCTGGRTKKAAQNYFPTLTDSAFVCIGDFIAKSLSYANNYAMQSITVACMPGKLCKYAANLANTHAHKTPQNLELLYSILATYKFNVPKNCASVREALEHLDAKARLVILTELAHMALENLGKRCNNNTCLRLLIIDFDGTFLLEEHVTIQTTHTSLCSTPSTAIDTDCAKPVIPIVNANDIGPTYFLRTS